MEPNPVEKERFDGVVRPLQEADIPALREILEHWLRDNEVVANDEVDKDVATLQESLKEGSGKHMFVAELEGQVIGMMGIAIPPKTELFPFVQTDSPSELIIAYVHPNHRGDRGVGTALINALQNFAKAQGRKEILLESGPRNIQSGYPFYDRQPGFKRAGQIKDFYGKGADTVVWQKTF